MLHRLKEALRTGSGLSEDEHARALDKSTTAVSLAGELNHDVEPEDSAADALANYRFLNG